VTKRYSFTNTQGNYISISLCVFLCNIHLTFLHVTLCILVLTLWNSVANRLEFPIWKWRWFMALLAQQHWCFVNDVGLLWQWIIIFFGLELKTTGDTTLHHWQWFPWSRIAWMWENDYLAKWPNFDILMLGTSFWLHRCPFIDILVVVTILFVSNRERHSMGYMGL